MTDKTDTKQSEGFSENKDFVTFRMRQIRG